MLMTEGLPVRRICAAERSTPSTILDAGTLPLLSAILTHRRAVFFATPAVLPPIMPATWVPSRRERSRRPTAVFAHMLAKWKEVWDIDQVVVTVRGGMDRVAAHNVSRSHTIRGQGYSRPLRSGHGLFAGKQLARPPKSLWLRTQPVSRM